MDKPTYKKDPYEHHLREIYKWHHFPFCPVKHQVDRDGGMPMCATLMKRPDNTFLLVHANMFSTPQEIEKASRKEYKTIDEVIADGWMID